MSSESESEEFYDAVDVSPKLREGAHAKDVSLEQQQDVFYTRKEPLERSYAATPTNTAQSQWLPAGYTHHQARDCSTERGNFGTDLTAVFKVPHPVTAGPGRHGRTKRTEDGRAHHTEDRISVAEDSCSSLSGSLLGNLHDDDEPAPLPTARLSTARHRRRHRHTAASTPPTSPPRDMHDPEYLTTIEPCGHASPCTSCVMQPFRVVEADECSLYSSISSSHYSAVPLGKNDSRWMIESCEPPQSAATDVSALSVSRGLRDTPGAAYSMPLKRTPDPVALAPDTCTHQGGGGTAGFLDTEARSRGLVLSAEPDLVASTKTSVNNNNSNTTSRSADISPRPMARDPSPAPVDSSSYLIQTSAPGRSQFWNRPSNNFSKPVTSVSHGNSAVVSSALLTGPASPPDRPPYSAIPFSSQSLPASSLPPKPPLPPLFLARKHKSHPALLHIAVVDPTRGIDHAGNIAEALNRETGSAALRKSAEVLLNNTHSKNLFGGPKIDAATKDSSTNHFSGTKHGDGGTNASPSNVKNSNLTSSMLRENSTMLHAVDTNNVGLVMNDNLLSKLQHQTREFFKESSSSSSSVKKPSASKASSTTKPPGTGDGIIDTASTVADDTSMLPPLPPPVAPPRKRRRKRMGSSAEEDTVSMSSSCSQSSKSGMEHLQYQLHNTRIVTSTTETTTKNTTMTNTTTITKDHTNYSTASATTLPLHHQQTPSLHHHTIPTFVLKRSTVVSLPTNISAPPQPAPTNTNTAPPTYTSAPPQPAPTNTNVAPPNTNAAPPSIPAVRVTTPTPPRTPLLSSISKRSSKLLRTTKIVNLPGLITSHMGGRRKTRHRGAGTTRLIKDKDDDSICDTISIGQRSLDVNTAVNGKFIVKDFGRASTPTSDTPSPPVLQPAAPAAAAAGPAMETDTLEDQEILAQVSLLNLDTGVRVSLSEAPPLSPNPLNPLSLQIMKLTNRPASGGEGGSDDDNSSIASSSRDSDTDSTVPLGHSVKRKTAKMKKMLERRMGAAVLRAAKSITTRQGEDKDVFADDAPTTSTGTYVKIKTSHSHKGPHEWDDLMYVQELQGEHQGPVWCAKFSLCGRLLATAGQDQLLRVWVIKQAFHFFLDIRTKYNPDIKISPTPSEESLGSQSTSDPSTTDDLLDPYNNVHSPFMPRPFCVYEGHSADLLDVAWSKNYFLLTSSMDKTVRLWHISRTECLCIFQHVDFVTAIAFHPKDDRYFISGSLDGKLRLWSIPEKRVVLWTEVQGAFITAANFCQNGAYTVVGTYDGRCLFYTTNQLKYNTQFNVRSARGKNSKGRKITGIESLPGENKVLVTSNDSRIRLYGLDEHSEHCKYRGLSNLSSQIRASFSHDGKYIVAGSENQCIYIWKTHHDHGKFGSTARRDRNAYWEGVKAHNAVVTCALFSPHPELVFNFIEQQQEQQQQESASASSSTGNGGGDKQPPKHDSLGTNKGYMLVSADFNGCIKVFLKKEKPKHSSLPASAMA